MHLKHEVVPTKETIQHPQVSVNPYTILYSTEVLTVLTVTGLALYKWVLEPWLSKKKLTLSYSRNQDDAINAQLDLIRTKANADRVLLIQTYVTSKTMADDILRGISITHQRPGEGVPLISSAIPSPPNDSCIRAMLKSLKENPFIKRDVHSIESDLYRIYLVASNVSYVSYCFLVVDDVPMGFVSIQYCNPTHEKEWLALTQPHIQIHLDKLLYHIINRKTIFGTLKGLFASN